MANTPTAASAALLSPISAGEAALVRHSHDRSLRAKFLGAASRGDAARGIFSKALILLLPKAASLGKNVVPGSSMSIWSVGWSAESVCCETCPWEMSCQTRGARSSATRILRNEGDLWLNFSTHGVQICRVCSPSPPLAHHPRTLPPQPLLHPPGAAASPRAEQGEAPRGSSSPQMGAELPARPQPPATGRGPRTSPGAPCAARCHPTRSKCPTSGVPWRGWELAGDLRAGRQADKTQLLSSQKGKELQRLGKMR